MTTGPTELVGLPVGGPTSVALVKDYLAISDSRDDTRLETIVAAVNAQVRSWRCSEAAVVEPPAPPLEDWPGNIVLGATMLGARLLRRKNSPGGVEAFGTDGAVYVSRTDPDVAQLLGLGSWQPPVVG